MNDRDPFDEIVRRMTHPSVGMTTYHPALCQKLLLPYSFSRGTLTLSSCLIGTPPTMTPENPVFSPFCILLLLFLLYQPESESPCKPSAARPTCRSSCCSSIPQAIESMSCNARRPWTVCVSVLLGHGPVFLPSVNRSRGDETGHVRR